MGPIKKTLRAPCMGADHKGRAGARAPRSIIQPQSDQQEPAYGQLHSTVRESDAVPIIRPLPPMIEALTLVAAAAVPPLTVVCTRPPASLSAEAGEIEIPPAVEVSAKFTPAPARGAPEPSSTRKVTVAVDGPADEPAPFRAILDGVAETNRI